MGSGLLTDFKNQMVLADGEQTIVPQVMSSSPLTGAAIDCSDMDGSCWAVLVTGAVSGGTTAPSLTAKLQESDASGGTYADIAGATFGSAITTLNHVRAITFRRTKRFVKAVAATTGTAPTVAVVCVIGGQKKAIST